MTLYVLVLMAIALYYLLFIKPNSIKEDTADLRICCNCKSSIKSQNSICPVCKETLRRPCSCCGEQLDVTWQYCPYCEKPING